MSDNMPEKTIVAVETDFSRKNMSRRRVLKAFAAIFSGIAASAIAKNSWSAQEESKMLIIYFSHSGNTRLVAREIQTFTNAQMVEIKPVKPFPTNNDALVNLAEKEAAENFRPEFTAAMPKDLQEYDVIFLGFPIWAYTMPMIVHSFLDKYHFPGKKIAPFSTHEGSGLANAPEQIRNLCPDATILQGLAIRGSKAANSSAQVKNWLEQLGLIK